MIERITGGTKPAAQQIINDEGAKVPDVRRVVNGRAAAVDQCGLSVPGRERIDGSRQAVVERFQRRTFGGEIGKAAAQAFFLARHAVDRAGPRVIGGAASCQRRSAAQADA